MTGQQGVRGLEKEGLLVSEGKTKSIRKVKLWDSRQLRGEGKESTEGGGAEKLGGR